MEYTNTAATIEQRGDLQHLRHAIQFEQSAERDDLGRQRLHHDQHRGDNQAHHRQHAGPAALRLIEQQVQHQNGAGGQRQENLRPAHTPGLN